MAKQTFTTGQVLTAAQVNALQANDYNVTVSAKVASYVLVAADAGTRITMSNAGATTITVNTGLFTAGDTLVITNIGAGASTITAGTATVSTASSLVLAQYESGRLYFTSTGVAIFEKYAGAAGGSTLTLAQIATGSMSGTSVTISSLSTYDTIILGLTGLVWGTASDYLRLRINSLTSANYINFGHYDAGGGRANAYQAATYIHLAPNTMLYTDTANNWFIKFTNCKAAGFTDFNMVGRYVDPTTASTGLAIAGQITSAATVDSLVISTSASYTFSAGTYTVWGG